MKRPQCHKCGWEPSADEEDTLWQDGPDYICGTCLDEELSALPLAERARAFGLREINGKGVY